MPRKLYILIGLVLLFVHPVIVSAKYDIQRKKDKVKTETHQPTPDILPTKASQARKHSSSAEVYGLDLWTNIGKEGLDVSHYQGTIDWEKVHNTDKNISYVYLKATEGESLVDDTYRRNLEEAKRVGLKVGSYHFYRPNVSIEAQFQNLKNNIQKEEQDIIPLVDVETKGNVSQEQFIADLKAFLEKVTAYYGKRPLLYTFYNFYHKYMQDDFLEYKLMIARYHTDVPVLLENRKYIIWQYTSKGKVLGIKGNVDRSKIMPGFSIGDLIY